MYGGNGCVISGWVCSHCFFTLSPPSSLSFSLHHMHGNRASFPGLLASGNETIYGVDKRELYMETLIASYVVFLEPYL